MLGPIISKLNEFDRECMSLDQLIGFWLQFDFLRILCEFQNLRISVQNVKSFGLMCRYESIYENESQGEQSNRIPFFSLKIQSAYLICKKMIVIWCCKMEQ